MQVPSCQRSGVTSSCFWIVLNTLPKTFTICIVMNVLKSSQNPVLPAHSTLWQLHLESDSSKYAKQIKVSKNASRTHRTGNIVKNGKPVNFPRLDLYSKWKWYFKISKVKVSHFQGWIETTSPRMRRFWLSILILNVETPSHPFCPVKVELSILLIVWLLWANRSQLMVLVLLYFAPY